MHALMCVCVCVRVYKHSNNTFVMRLCSYCNGRTISAFMTMMMMIVYQSRNIPTKFSID